MDPQIDPNSIRPLDGPPPSSPTAQPGGNPSTQIDPASIRPLTDSDTGGGPATPQQQPPSDEIQVDPKSGSLSNLAHVGGALFEGVGEGVFSGLAGGVDLAHKLGEKIAGHPLSNDTGRVLHHLAGDDNTQRGAIQSVGYGGETLAEFMLGDETLKGLSKADQLGVVSKWMKIAEKSPRLIKAIQTGADLAKVEGELSPEEIQLIRNNPRIAKYIGIAVNALRGGIVQGAQTTLRTGGDVGAGAKDALGTAGTGAVLGGIIHGGTAVLQKGGRAANTIHAMTQIAEGAPESEHTVQGQIADAVHRSFANETGTLQNNLDDATSTIGMYGEGAPGLRSITKASQEYAKAGKKAVQQAYDGSFEKLKTLAGDTTIPFTGSTWHNEAEALAREGLVNTGDLDRALNVSRPGSPEANRIIDNLVREGRAGEAGEAGTSSPNLGGTPPPTTSPDIAELERMYDLPSDEEVTAAAAEGTPTNGEGGIGTADPEAPEATPEPDAPGANLNMKQLVEYRQNIAKRLRNVTVNNLADKPIYARLLRSVDDTIGELADKAGGYKLDAEGNPIRSEARQLFDTMNTNYREGIAPFSNRDVKNVLKGNLNDVAKSIMAGSTSVDDILHVQKALGPKNFQKVSQASLQNIVQQYTDEASGEVDYQKLFKDFNKIKPDVRAAMFGNQGQALRDALKVANQSSDGLSAIGQTIDNILSTGKIDSFLADPAKAQRLAEAVGPEGMKTLGRSILENQIRQASTAFDTTTGEIKPARFDPDRVLNWWMGMKDNPEVRKAFFTMDKDSATQVHGMMQRLAETSSVKKLVKYGVLPVVGAAGGWVGSGGLAPLIGAVAGLGGDALATKFGRVEGVLDSIANHPATWRALATGGTVADKASSVVVNSPAASQAFRTKTAHSIYQSLSGNLGGGPMQDRVVIPADPDRGIHETSVPVVPSPPSTVTGPSVHAGPEPAAGTQGDTAPDTAQAVRAAMTPALAGSQKETKPSPYSATGPTGGAVTPATVAAVAKKEGVPEDLLRAVIGTESQGRQTRADGTTLTSSKGALGVSQMLPSTARDMRVDPRNATQNLQGGARYLKLLLDRYNGDKATAVAAYNWGMGNVDTFLAGGEKRMPKETRDYITHILGKNPLSDAHGRHVARTAPGNQ